MRRTKTSGILFLSLGGFAAWRLSLFMGFFSSLTLPLPPDIDVLAIDPGLQRLYAASESGIVAVFAIAPDHGVAEVGRGFVGPNAHTVAVDPATHRVYFPLPDIGGQRVPRIMVART